MTTARSLAAVALASACAIVVACQSIVGLREPVETPDPCEHVSVPPKPDLDDEPETSLPPSWYAIRHVDVVGDADGGAAGFDLDGVCTCAGAGARGAGESCKGYATEPHCDLSGGVDNGVRRMIESQSQLSFPGIDLHSLGVDARAARGENTILIWVSGYNGKANDKSVFVGTLLAQQLVAVDNCNAAPPQPSTDGGTPIPAGGAKWNGCDRWAVGESQAVGDLTPTPTITNEGYVANGVLVLNGGASTAFAILGNPISVRSSRARFQFTEGGISGTIAGRLDPLSVLRGIGSLNILSGSPPLCQTVLFSQLVDAVCKGLDIASSPGIDFTDKRCDAMSSGVDVAAERVLPPVRAKEPSQIAACDAVIGTSIDVLCSRQ